MKKLQLSIVLLMLASISTTTLARSLVVRANNGSESAKNAVVNEFGLSGTINRYSAKQSIINIDGKNYILKGKGSLTNADLKSRLKIKYNLEKSAKEKMGRVTRIWIEEK